MYIYLVRDALVLVRVDPVDLSDGVVGVFWSLVFRDVLIGVDLVDVSVGISRVSRDVLVGVDFVEVSVGVCLISRDVLIGVNLDVSVRVTMKVLGSG